ncbi:MAG: hypothetical protein ABS904_00310 [Solibacillus isronensis]
MSEFIVPNGENEEQNMVGAVKFAPESDGPYIVRLLDHVDKTFHVSAKSKRPLMETLTRGGRNPKLENTVLDITDVPMSRDAFNIWLLDLIRNTELVVVDNSVDIVLEEGIRPISKADGTITEKYLDPVPYPYDIDFTLDEFDEDLMPVRVTWVKKGGVICTGINQFEFAEKDQEFRHRIRHIVEPVTVRSDVINKVMLQRDLNKEIEPLSDYCEVNEKGSKVFTVESTNKVIERINGLIEGGQTIRTLFGLGDMPENKESAYNLAKLFIMTNELAELDNLSSGKSICTKYVYPYVSQFTYDYSSYLKFCEDFQRMHPEDTFFLMCKTRGIFERAKITEYRPVENDSGVSKVFVKFSYMEFGQTDREEEIDLRYFYSLHRIALPEGYSTGEAEGLLDFEERTKYFGRELKDMREFDEQINYDGISQFIGSDIHYDANTDYVKVYTKGLQEEYRELGLGDLPEIDLQAIISGAESPYSHTARREQAKKAVQKSKFSR